jgi:hypothetical protein
MEKLTAQEAIDDLEIAIENNNRQMMLDLVAPDDLDIMPDWDDESDHVFEKWDELCDIAMEKLGL